MEANLKRLQKLMEMEKANVADPFFKFAMAQEYIAMNDFAKAEWYFEKLVNDFPDYLPTYYHFAKIIEQKNNFDEAVALYKKGIELAALQGEAAALKELKEALFMIEE